MSAAGLMIVARVGLVEPGQHAQQRRLAGAVRSAQADAVAVGDLPGDVVEQDAFAEGLGEGGQLNHGMTLGGHSTIFETRARLAAARSDLAATGSVSPTARAATARMRGSRNGLVR